MSSPAIQSSAVLRRLRPQAPGEFEGPINVPNAAGSHADPSGDGDCDGRLGRSMDKKEGPPPYAQFEPEFSAGRSHLISEGYSTEVEIITQAEAWLLLGRAELLANYCNCTAVR